MLKARGEEKKLYRDFFVAETVTFTGVVFVLKKRNYVSMNDTLKTLRDLGYTVGQIKPGAWRIRGQNEYTFIDYFPIVSKYMLWNQEKAEACGPLFIDDVRRILVPYERPNGMQQQAIGDWRMGLDSLFKRFPQIFLA